MTLIVIRSLTHHHNIYEFTEYIYATLPRTQRGQPIVLGGDPKGKNFLYTNGNSVIIRNIEVSKRTNETTFKNKNIC